MAKIAVNIPDPLITAIEGAGIGKTAFIKTFMSGVFNPSADPATYELRYLRLVAALMAGDLEPIMTGQNRLQLEVDHG